MRQLTSLDAQFLAVESARIYGHVAFLGIYDPSTAPGGRLGADEVKRLLEERLHLLPPLRWRLVEVPLGLDLPYWVDDPDFDLDFHIRESAVPPPGDDRQLAETVARIFGPPARPRPAAVGVLRHPRARRAAASALLTKIHHSAVDGISGNEIMAALLDPEPEGRVIEPPPPRYGARRRSRATARCSRAACAGSRASRCARCARCRRPSRASPTCRARTRCRACRRSRTSTRGVRRTFGADESAGVLEVTKARAADDAVQRPGLGRIGGSRSARSRSTPCARSGASSGTTVNDVVVTLCAGAVREWLLERDALPEDPLVAMIPMSVRKRDEQRRLGQPDLDDDRADPDQRARPGDPAASARTSYLRSAKERHSALPASLLTDATAFIPPAVASLAARNTVDILSRTRPPLNLVISNVPGPRTSLYCAGAELQSNFPVSVIVDGVGLNITVVSYKDRVDFGIVGDREQIDDAWSLIDGMRRALDELGGGGRGGDRVRNRRRRDRVVQAAARRSTATTSAVGRNGSATTRPVSTPIAATGSDPTTASSTRPDGGLEESSCASRLTAGASSGRATRRVSGEASCTDDAGREPSCPSHISA